MMWFHFTLLLVTLIGALSVTTGTSPPRNKTDKFLRRHPGFVRETTIATGLSLNQRQSQSKDPLSDISLNLSRPIGETPESKPNVARNYHLSMRTDLSLVDQLKQCFQSKALRVPIAMDGDNGYDDNVENMQWNKAFPAHPLAVVAPNHIRDVQKVVECAGKVQLPVQAMAGGHSFGGFSSRFGERGIVINLRYLKEITYDYKNDIVTVQGGVLLGALAFELIPWRRAVSHGECPGVGVAGHFLHGGMGDTSRMWGLSTDFIRSIDVVTADGKILHASQTEHSDLFYAMRGAGSSFGIAVKLELNTVQAPEEIYDFHLHGVHRHVTATANALVKIQECTQSPEFGRATGLSVHIHKAGLELSIIGSHFGDRSHIDRVILPCFQEAFQDGDLDVEEVTKLDDFGDFLTEVADPQPLQEPYEGYYERPRKLIVKSLTLPEDGPPDQKAWANGLKYMAEMADDSTDGINLRLLGGADSQVPLAENPTPISWRNGLWVVSITSSSDSDAVKAGAHKIWSALAQTTTGQSYYGFTPFLDGTLSRKEAHRTYYSSEVIAELEHIKAKYDPKQIFRNPHSIEPKTS